MPHRARSTLAWTLVLAVLGTTWTTVWRGQRPDALIACTAITGLALVAILAHAFAVMRRELLALRAREQQQGLFRGQLRKLVDSLEAPACTEFGWNVGPGDPPCGQDAALADLVRTLHRMSGQASTQQGRLAGLLRELRQATEQQSILASLQQELEIARNMQLSILPRTAVHVPGVEVSALMVPAREVGGDFYDYFMLDDSHLAVVIADVSGKGIPAAFFMAISRTLLKCNALFLREPAKVLDRLNDQLCAENEQMMFVTAFFAVLDLRSGELEFVNAGHNPPVIRDRRADVSLLPRNQNAALAVLQDHRYQQGRIHLQSGDTLLLYTDGVTEASDPLGRMFGEDRLLQTVMAHGCVGDLPQALLQQVRAFENGSTQSDDITCIAVRYVPESSDMACVP